MPEKIGFVGLGRMGANMARRLKDVGYPTAAVFDVRADAAKELAAELGAEATTKLARVTALSDIVITVVTDDKAQLGVFAALGVDLPVLMKVFSQTGANSRVLATDGEDMLNRDHSCFFSSAHAAKDSGIALKLAKEQKLNLPLAAATLAQYTRMVKL